jgi:hypothetical protein
MILFSGRECANLFSMKERRTAMRSVIVLAAATLLSGCSLIGAEGSPRQMQEARAVHVFVSSIGPYGQRIAAANAIHQPQLYGLNPYFGR